MTVMLSEQKTIASFDVQKTQLGKNRYQFCVVHIGSSNPKIELILLINHDLFHDFHSLWRFL
jgi:hypothetical protein